MDYQTVDQSDWDGVYYVEGRDYFVYLDVRDYVVVEVGVFDGDEYGGFRHKEFESALSPEYHEVDPEVVANPESAIEAVVSDAVDGESEAAEAFEQYELEFAAKLTRVERDERKLAKFRERDPSQNDVRAAD